MNGSQTTVSPSRTPKSRSSCWMSSGVVTGVIRSTMQLGNATSARSQAPSSGSARSAYAANIRRAISPLPGRLSQDMTVNGGTPAARRRRSASTTKPNTVPGVAPGRRSARTAGLAGSNSPVTWLKL